jgi:hypothetical protein
VSNLQFKVLLDITSFACFTFNLAYMLHYTRFCNTINKESIILIIYIINIYIFILIRTMVLMDFTHTFAHFGKLVPLPAFTTLFPHSWTSCIFLVIETAVPALVLLCVRVVSSSTIVTRVASFLRCFSPVCRSYRSLLSSARSPLSSSVRSATTDRRNILGYRVRFCVH